MDTLVITQRSITAKQAIAKDVDATRMGAQCEQLWKKWVYPIFIDTLQFKIFYLD